MTSREVISRSAAGLRRLLLGRGGAAFEARFAEAFPARNEFGVDPFGYSLDYSLWVLGPLLWFYRHYYRVQCHGIEKLPAGRVLLVANHSGQIPIDAGMIACATLLEAPRPRAVRGMTEKWIATLPVASTFMARTGMVVGTPENCRKLLAAEEAVLVFPEGIRGIVKPWKKRYRLQEFGAGFVRLALQTATPIVPVAVIGGEEQMPAIAQSAFLGRLLGIPSVPLPVTLFPFPAKYHLWFGDPLRIEGDPRDSEADLSAHAGRVKEELQRMIQRGLAERRHVFW